MDNNKDRDLKEVNSSASREEGHRSSGNYVKRNTHNNSDRSRYNNKSRDRGSQKKGKALPDKTKDRGSSRVIHEEFPAHNDWSWYAPSETIARQIASIPFNVLAGHPLPVVITQATAESPGAVKDATGTRASVLGARITYYPSFGVSKNTTDGITMAANQLYAFDRKSNSGAKVYESPDLMITVLAVQEAVRTMLEIKRALTYSLYWNFYNRYLPKQLFTSLLCIDYDDIAANRANYVAQYNIMVQRFNTFALPAYFKSVLRAAYIASNIFMDSDAITGQMYAFVARGRYIFDSTGDSNGTRLRFSGYSLNVSSPRKLSELFNALTEQVDAIFGDSDAQTMFGDLIKAFGSDQLYSLAELQIDEVTPPVFDIDILAQIENADFVHQSDAYSYSVENPHLTQTDGQILVWQPRFLVRTVGNQPVSSSRPLYFTFTNSILNSHVMEPDYTDVLEWTRLKLKRSLLYVNDDANDKAERVYEVIEGCGAELCFDMNYMCYVYDSNGKVKYTQAYNFQQLEAFQVISDFALPRNHPMLYQLDWHPLVYVMESDEFDEVVENGGISVSGDLKRPTIIQSDVLGRILEAGNYALYYNPGLLANIGKQ